MKKHFFLGIIVSLLLAGLTRAQEDKKNLPGVFVDYGPPRYEVRAPKYDKDGNLVDPGDYPNAPLTVNPEVLPPDGLYVDYKPDTIRFRHPVYDKDGNLLDHGDYPDAPLKVDPEKLTGDNIFIDNGTTTYQLREPKYDEEGNLVDPGDYPNAPLKIDPDKLTPSGVLMNDNPSRIQLRQPIYDKNGDLVDYGDFPHASKHVDPDKLYPEETVGDVSTEPRRRGVSPSNKIDGVGSCFAYFPDKVGQMWTLNNYDKRGRLTSSTQNVIKSASGGKVIVQTFSFDKNGEPLGLKDKDGTIKTVEGEFEAYCDGGRLLVKPDSFKSSLLQWFQGLDAEVTGDIVELSLNSMEEGKTLPNYALKITIESFIKTVIDIRVSQRYVKSTEVVETPAGTFNCWRIDFTTQTKMGIVNKTNRSSTWLAPGVGMVKNVTYRNNGNVLSKTVLEDMNW